jgi:hypothetical protein
MSANPVPGEPPEVGTLAVTQESKVAAVAFHYAARAWLGMRLAALLRPAATEGET